MVDTLLMALKNNASSHTRKYYINTLEGRKAIADLMATIKALINADYNESIHAHNGAEYDQTEYSVVGNVSELWRASIVYPTNKDLTRRSNVLKKFEITSSPVVEYEDKDDNKMTYEGKILTPFEVNIVIDNYNADQKDNEKKLVLTKLSGLKGVEFYDFTGFVRDNSIAQGNLSGTVDVEVSVIFNYENPLGPTAIIDEISSKVVETWLLSKKSTNSENSQATN